MSLDMSMSSFTLLKETFSSLKCDAKWFVGRNFFIPHFLICDKCTVD